MRTWLALALVVAGCGEDAPRASGVLRGSASPEALWVLTYNVNFERASDDTVRAIEDADADLVFLQEVHADWERRIRERLGDRYPHARYRPAVDEGGMAILSRHPFTETRHERTRSGEFPSWRVRVETPLGPLDVLHVHLHPPVEDGSLVVGYFTTSDARWDELVHHLRGGAPDLVLGDFNEGEGAAIAHLEALGLEQAQRAWPPVELTWTWDTGSTELEGRPDHVFVGPRFRTAAVQVMRAGGSDHHPLRVAIEAAR